MPPRRLVLLLALLPLLAAAPASAKPSLGFAEQNASMFADPRFTDLHVTQARVNVPWDVFSDRYTLPQLKAWMAGAKHDRVKALVTVNRSRQAGKSGVNPTNAQMTAFIVRMRAAFPGQVSLISTWNEANLNKKPTIVAGWYRALRDGCPSCTILGADLVDTPNEISWAKAFIAANGGRAPKVWGLHNYIDVNNYASTRTTAFSRQVPGDIWLTETGGVLSRAHGKAHFAGTGDAHATKATRFLLETIAPSASFLKIKQIYLYSWSTSVDDTTWDSGMIGPDGTERGMLRVVRKYLGVARIARPAIPPPPNVAPVAPEE